MHARASKLDLTLRREGDALRVRRPDGAEWRLSRVAEAVWRACDGTRPVALLARIAEAQVGTSVSEETVWSALDGLADTGLLVRRVTPPASALQRLALVPSAAASLVMPAGSATRGDKPSTAGDDFDDEDDADVPGRAPDPGDGVRPE